MRPWKIQTVRETISVLLPTTKEEAFPKRCCGDVCMHALLTGQYHHLAEFFPSELHALTQNPEELKEHKESQKKNQPTPIPAANHPPARLSDLNSGALLTLTTAHRRAAGKGCRPPITGWSGAASETAAVGFESSATAWPCRRLVQLSIRPPCKQPRPRLDSQLPHSRMEHLHQLADATVSVPILALDSGRNACRVDGGVGSMVQDMVKREGEKLPGNVWFLKPWRWSGL